MSENILTKRKGVDYLMRNKTRMIALALVLGVALVGAGYAAWGTQITDNTTLRSGHWSIVLEDDWGGSGPTDTGSFGTRDGYAIFDENGDEIGEVEYENVDLYDEQDPTNLAKARKVNGDNYVYTIRPTMTDTTATFMFYNMHPGARACTQFEIRNKGTIGAKVGNVTVNVNGTTVDQLSGKEKELADAIMVEGSIVNHTGSWLDDEDEYDLLADLDLVSLGGLEAKLEEVLRDVELAPQQGINIGYGSELEFVPLTFYIPAGELDGNLGMEAELEVKIQFDFVQYNQGTPTSGA